MKTMNLNSKMLLATTLLGMVALATPMTANAQSIPNSSLEFTDGPTSKLDLVAIQNIKNYATNAKSDIDRLLNAVSQMNDSTEIKIRLYNGINNIITSSKDSRSILLLTHSLQAGMTLVKLIDQQSIQRGLEFTPQGTVDQQIRIMKQSLNFAKEYYESDFSFINGVLEKNEIKTNPKFVEFGLKLNRFIIKMSDGVLNARSTYGMIRWSLGVLSNYIKNDKETGLAYASTQYNLVTTLSEKEISTGKIIFPDIVIGETAPTDIECISKIRILKQLAQQSEKEMVEVNKSLGKSAVFLSSVSAQSINKGEKAIPGKIVTPDNNTITYNVQYQSENKAVFSNIFYIVGKCNYKIFDRDPQYNFFCITLGFKKAIKEESSSSYSYARDSSAKINKIGSVVAFPESSTYINSVSCTN